MMLSRKIVMITGATSGIGKATAFELAGRGVNLMLNARRATELNQVALDIATRNAECIARTCAADLRDLASIDDLFRECESAFGGIDVLINNAGVGKIEPIAAVTPETWDNTINTNLRAAFFCSQRAIPIFEKRGGGLIINISSAAAVYGYPNFAAYTASKAGLLGMSRAMRVELRKKRVRVSVVMPGATQSAFWDGADPAKWDPTRMVSASAMARVIADIACQPAEMTTEEVVVMPTGGAL